MILFQVCNRKLYTHIKFFSIFLHDAAQILGKTRDECIQFVGTSLQLRLSRKRLLSVKICPK